MEKIVAVLSTTVLPQDGLYVVGEANINEVNIKDVPHYIGHPATKEIVEQLGAVQAPNKLFEGLKVGETAVCFAIKQGLSSRAALGKTVDQEVTPDMLSVRFIERVSYNRWECPFCGHENLSGHFCSNCGAE